MARMFPDTEKNRVIFSSGAEQRVYQRCRDMLSDDWHVYYSCTLSVMESGRGMRDNEIDFVFFHPRYGVIIAEVKGGRIGFDADAQTYYSINRFNERHNIRNPFQQVLIWKSRFIRYLISQRLRIPAAHTVILPSVSEDELPQASHLERAVVIGMSRLQELEESLVQIAEQSRPDHRERHTNRGHGVGRGHHAGSKHHVNDEHPTRNDHQADSRLGEEVDKLLRGTHFTTRMHLREYIDNHEMRLRDIETISETLVTPIAGTGRLAVEGEAGTGKTMLAVMLARQFRDGGKRVLLLSSNPLLNVHLKKEAGNNVWVNTYEGLARTMGVELHRLPHGYEGTKDDWTQFEGPERLREAISKSEDRYDVLLCDEAQDVQPFWWEAFERLISDSDDSRFYVFFDRSQGIFGSGSKDRSFVPEEVLPIATPYFPLVHNYRTTREIAGFSRSFRTGKEILQSHCGRLGYKPEIITYDGIADFRRQIKRLIRRLIEEEGLRAEEITLLSARAPFADGSTLNGTNMIGKYPLLDLSASLKKGRAPDARRSRQKLRVSTVPSFKGLETSVGIVINLSEYNLPLTHPIMSSLLYVACTRAKHMLYLFAQHDDPKRTALSEAVAKLRQNGALVLEGSSADYEYQGKVVHYDPQRFGLLRVEDPGFERDKIMFFPHDVKASDIDELAVGNTLIFRPRLEGSLVIASALRRHCN